MNQTKLPTNNKLGFSDYRIWPSYLVFSIMILFLVPAVGAFWGLFIPFTIFTVVSTRVVAYLEKNNKMTTYPVYEELLKTLPKFLQEDTTQTQPVAIKVPKQTKSPISIDKPVLKTAQLQLN